MSKETVQKENVIQAVVIADCYTDNLEPITSNNVPCLLPLVNRPLLAYTLECLSSARVQEIILFCSKYADQIKEFVKSRRWGHSKITVVVSEGCRSFGDAMRDLDAKALIRGDFILLAGDVIGNLQLIPALEKHKKTQKTDKGATMTLMLKECGKKTKVGDDVLYLALNKNTNRVLFHNRVSSTRPKVDIPLEVLLDQSDVELRSDLLDTRVCICSISVPPLFAENFDFQTRDDFVRGLLMNEDILESTVYAYMLPNREYAASVTTWPAYQFVSHDIIRRWAYPHVPDMFIDSNYHFRWNHVYVDNGVSLDKTSLLKEDVVIAKGTTVAEHAVISCSVIGPDCNIMKSTVIKGSHFLSKVLIENEAHVENSVLGEGCIVKSGSKVFNSILGPGVVIEKGCSVSSERLQSTPSGKGELGPKAFIFKSEEEDSDRGSEDDFDFPLWSGLISKPMELQESENSSDSDVEMSERNSPLPDDTKLFYSEVVDSLYRGYEDELPCDNLILEINSSRYAYNVTVNEVNYFVIRAILVLEEKQTWDLLYKRILYFMPLINNYIKNEEAMMDALSAIQFVVGTYPFFHEGALKLVHFFYENDIVGEDPIMKWFKLLSPDIDSDVALLKQVQPFIKWLAEAETDSSEEE